MTIKKLILIQFTTYAICCNIFLILAYEFDEFKLNRTNECNIIDDEYCVHKPLKGNNTFLLK